MRLLNILVIAVLILSATFVYKIKFDSTLQAERVAKLRSELRRERDATARLRSEWARLDTPDRIQGLAERHLKLKAVQATQFDLFEQLPERPLPPPPASDPIASIIGPDTTGSISPKTPARQVPR
jgi:cell division protein FtsL